MGVYTWDSFDLRNGRVAMNRFGRRFIRRFPKYVDRDLTAGRAATGDRGDRDDGRRARCPRQRRLHFGEPGLIGGATGTGEIGLQGAGGAIGDPHLTDQLIDQEAGIRAIFAATDLLDGSHLQPHQGKNPCRKNQNSKQRFQERRAELTFDGRSTCFHHQHPRTSVEASAGSHKRIWPLTETTTRKQRTLPPTLTQAPPVGLERLS